MSRLPYLDQNHLSGIAKRKPAFTELEPVLRDAVARGAVSVVAAAVHERRPRGASTRAHVVRELTS